MNNAFQIIVNLYATLLGAKKLASLEDKEDIQKILDTDENHLTPTELTNLRTKLTKYNMPTIYSFQWDDTNIKHLYDHSLKPGTKKKNVNNHIKALEESFLAFKLPGEYPRCLSPLPYDHEEIKTSPSRAREGIATLLLQQQIFHEKKYPWEIQNPILDAYLNVGIDKNLHKALEEHTPLHVKTKEGNKDIMPVGIGHGTENEPMLLFENHEPLLFSQILETSLEPDREMKPFGLETTKEALILEAYEGVVFLTMQNAKEGMIKVIQKRTYKVKWIISPGYDNEITKDVTNYLEITNWPWRILDAEAIIVVSDEIFETFHQKRGKTKKPVILETQEEIDELIQLLQSEVKTSKEKYETLKCIKQIKELEDSKPMLMPIKSIRAVSKFF